MNNGYAGCGAIYSLHGTRHDIEITHLTGLSRDNGWLHAFLLIKQRASAMSTWTRSHLHICIHLNVNAIPCKLHVLLYSHV